MSESLPDIQQGNGNGDENDKIHENENHIDDNSNRESDSVQRKKLDRLLRLIFIFRDILEEEEPPTFTTSAIKTNTRSKSKQVITPVKDTDPIPHRRICDVCKTDIFNRRFFCSLCTNTSNTNIPLEAMSCMMPTNNSNGQSDEEENGGGGYDVCLQCYKTRDNHEHTLVLVETIPLIQLKILYERALSICKLYILDSRKRQQQQQPPALTNHTNQSFPLRFAPPAPSPPPW